jgi:peroxiredoxin
MHGFINRYRMGLAILFPVAALVLSSCESPAPEGKRTGDISVEIHGADVDGNRIKLSDFRGKVVLVNFWGTWCPPCRAQIPHEREMVESKYAGRPFVLLGIAKDSPATLRNFLNTNPLPWPNIAEGDSGVISRQWEVEGFPSAVLIDHDGRIIDRWLSGFDPKEVWAKVEEAVRAIEK